MLPAGNLDDVELDTTSCKHSLVLLRMGKIIARNILSCLELLINRYCCI